MLFIGIDLHKDSLTLAVLNAAGNLQKIVTLSTKCIHKIDTFFNTLPEPYVVGVEAIGFYHWLWDLLGDRPVKKLLGDPREINARKAVKRAKTDHKDAVLLAELLRRDEFPAVYVPTSEERALRELTRHRHSLARALARLKNRFHRLCLKRNLQGPRRMTAAHALRFYKGFAHHFAPNQQLMLYDLVELIMAHEEKVRQVEMRLSESLKAPVFAERLVLYESLPGTGLITAATLIAETGDITRFTHAGEVAAYAGLDPRVFQSADSCRHGRISKNGPHDLRWVLQQAAWTAIRCDTRCRAIYERIRLRAGKKKAATAVARHLIVWVWAMTRRNALYNPRQSAAA